MALHPAWAFPWQGSPEKSYGKRVRLSEANHRFRGGALCDHPRNLTDDQLKALAAQGGVAQICLYKGFINKEEDKASLSDAIRHINHIVDLIGIDHVGIGSDFDGDGELIGCSATNELINITVRLLEEGYTEEDIRKIWGGNLLRVMTAIQDFQNK